MWTALPLLGSILRQGTHHTKPGKCSGQQPHAPASVLWVGQRNRIHPDGTGLEQPQCLDVHTAVILSGRRRKQFGAMGTDTITPQASVKLAVFSKPGDNWRLMKPRVSRQPYPHIAADLRRVQTHIQEGSRMAPDLVGDWPWPSGGPHTEPLLLETFC